MLLNDAVCQNKEPKGEDNSESRKFDSIGDNEKILKLSKEPKLIIYKESRIKLYQPFK